MALPRLPFGQFLNSRQLISGLHENNVSNLLSSFGPVVALAGGGLTGLTPVIDNAFTELTVVATAGDSVSLPLAKMGLRCCITNIGANSAQIFGRNGTSDTIQGTAGNVGVALPANATALFICRKDGVWIRFVSA